MSTSQPPQTTRSPRLRAPATAATGDAPVSGPVFVDATGRRQRWVHQAINAGALLVMAYFVLLAASLTGAPWVPDVALPVVGKPLPQAGLTTPPTLGPGAQSQPAPVLSVTPVTAPKSAAPSATTLPATGKTHPPAASPTTARPGVPTTAPASTTIPGHHGHSGTTRPHP